MDKTIKEIEGKSGLLGMELEGLFKESLWLEQGLVLQFHKPVGRGKKKSAGDLVCTVCSSKIFNSAIIVEETDTVAHLKNGLTVLY